MAAESIPVTRAMIWRARADRTIRGLGDAFTGWLVPAIFIAVTPGVVVYAIKQPVMWGSYTGANHGTPEMLGALLSRVVSSIVVMASLYAILIAYERAQHGSTVAEAARRWNARLAFFVAALILTPMLADGWVAGHPFLTMLQAAAAGGCCAISAAAIAPSIRVRIPSRAAAVLAGLALAAMAAFYVWKIVTLQIAQHHGFRTQTYDLGIYVNCVWQTLHGNLLGSSFLRGGTHTSAHFDPLLILVAPVYLVREGAESLFVVQALLLVTAVVPVYLLGQKHGGRGFGLVLAFALLMHPAMHGVNLFEFHSMSLSLPFLTWSVYLAEQRRYVLYSIALTLLYLTREDMAVAAGCIGLYAIVYLKQPRLGAVTILTAIAYLFFAKLYGMAQTALFPPDTETSYSLDSFFEEIAPPGHGIGAVIASFLANPGFLIKHIFAERRVLFMLQIVSPLAFLPLLGGRRWVVVLYGLVVALLASRWAAYTLGYHYAAVLIPGAFIVTPPAIAALAKRLERHYGIEPRRVWAGAGAAIVVATLATSAAFGAFFDNPRFTTGAAQWPLVREMTPELTERYEAFLRLTRDIPPDAPIAASALPLPHLAARDRIMELTEIDDADWVVVVDEMITGAERPFWNRVRRDPRFELVGSQGTLYVYRRRPG